MTFDASALVGAGFSLRYTARDLKVAPTDPLGLVAAAFRLRSFSRHGTAPRSKTRKLKLAATDTPDLVPPLRGGRHLEFRLRPDPDAARFVIGRGVAELPSDFPVRIDPPDVIPVQQVAYIRVERHRASMLAPDAPRDFEIDQKHVFHPRIIGDEQGVRVEGIESVPGREIGVGPGRIVKNDQIAFDSERQSRLDVEFQGVALVPAQREGHRSERKPPLGEIDPLVRIFADTRSEEHTSELQSPYVISYAVFC